MSIYMLQLSKTSLQPRRQNTTPSPTTDNSDGEIPEFDPNKISLQVPDELFAPAFNSVNSISTVVGNLIQVMKALLENIICCRISLL